MSDLTDLSILRNQYLELARLYFSEVQSGKAPEELDNLKAQMAATLEEIKQREGPSA